MITSLPSSPEPSSMTLVAVGERGVPSRESVFMAAKNQSVISKATISNLGVFGQVKASRTRNLLILPDAVVMQGPVQKSCQKTAWQIRSHTHQKMYVWCEQLKWKLPKAHQFLMLERINITPWVCRMHGFNYTIGRLNRAFLCPQ